jgi:hypothetical protein
MNATNFLSGLVITRTIPGARFDWCAVIWVGHWEPNQITAMVVRVENTADDQ